MLQGNQIVTGQTGIVRLARFNIRSGCWNSGRRGAQREQMALANAALELLVQPDLFDDYVRPSEVVAFIVSCFSPMQPQPDSICIAVPDRSMRGWLFREPMSALIARYDAAASAKQVDKAKPKLKKGIGKQQGNSGAIS